jgi:hypothetical protein
MHSTTGLLCYRIIKYYLHWTIFKLLYLKRISLDVDFRINSIYVYGADDKSGIFFYNIRRKNN